MYKCRRFFWIHSTDIQLTIVFHVYCAATWLGGKGKKTVSAHNKLTVNLGKYDICTEGNREAAKILRNSKNEVV